MADVLPGFLSAHEVTALRALADAPVASMDSGDGWRPGRQHSGYDILPLKTTLPDELRGALDRALAAIGAPVGDLWDVYLIRYAHGAHIPPHVDPAEPGKRHRRINAVLTPATRGGELVIDAQPIALAVGDAVRFFSDREVHAVSRVEGARLLFSVGAWILG